MIYAACYCLLASSVYLGPSTMLRGDEPQIERNAGANVAQNLDKPDEIKFRKSVYKGDLMFCTPREGEWANFEVALVPKEIQGLYKKNKPGSVRLLISILEGARPQDATVAAGFAISLLDSPVNAAVLSKQSFDSFDNVVPTTGISSREFLLQVVKRLAKSKMIPGF